ncbi:MAG: replicative DNA helicase [Bdellovibrionales bacterium]|nr:replicative DNA helicase [Bdellovibrionales bacterium]
MRQPVPPNNIEAEQSVIGGLMLDPASMDDVQGLVAAEDFYKPAHSKIFNAIEELYKSDRPFDLVTITNYLTDRGEFETIGGAQVLHDIFENTITSANIKHHAEIVRDKSKLRQIITKCNKLLEEAYEPKEGTVDDFINHVESEVYSIAESRNSLGLHSASEIMKSTMERIHELYQKKAEITGVPTGFNDLDKMTAGLQPGDLVIVAARPAMGKTAFSLNLATNAALRAKRRVAYFSLEMSKESLMMRILASEARIDMSQLKIGKVSDSAWSDLISTASRLTEAPLYIDDTSSISPFEILAKCRRLKKQHGLDLIVVDYLQLMELKQKVESRERAVSEISKTLKRIAKELGVAVIALAQLNRGVESRTDRRPMVSDLRESGSIEQDADIIMMIYREDYYEKENPDIKGIAEIIVGKHRNGPTGTVKLAWLAQHGQFANLAPMGLEPPPNSPGGGGGIANFTPKEPSKSPGGLPNFAKRI